MMMPSLKALLLIVSVPGLIAGNASAQSRQPESQKTDSPVLFGAASTSDSDAAEITPASPARICTLISEQAKQNGLPDSFFARLIWKESRFDANAISPAGAEGIAQFMPATARRRGLDDSFDIEQAIPASASYLSELKAQFGNLGLAAAAYNAGENRVSRWLTAGGFLPLETENYVRDITGEAADEFTDATRQIVLRPLDEKLPFTEACRQLPASQTSTTPMSEVSRKPWAVIVAGGVGRKAAIRSWERMRDATRFKIAEEDVYVSQRRLAGGRGGTYSVRIGAGTRGKANDLCAKLKADGGACIVLKNR